MIYPQKLSSKKSEKILNICLISSVIIAILLVIINRITNSDIHWAALANCGIIYTWITVMYSIKKSRNIAGHVLLQTIAISAATLYIDYRIGFNGWSMTVAIPIILIVSNITMSILTLVSYKKYIQYAMCQLVIVIMSLTSIYIITNNLMELTLLNNIAMIISIINLVLTLILCYKDVKDAIVMKFHM